MSLLPIILEGRILNFHQIWEGFLVVVLWNFWINFLRRNSSGECQLTHAYFYCLVYFSGFEGDDDTSIKAGDNNRMEQERDTVSPLHSFESENSATEDLGTDFLIDGRRSTIGG